MPRRWWYQRLNTDDFCNNGLADEIDKKSKCVLVEFIR